MALFSIIIPVHNRAELVRATLESVFAQTCGDYEIVAVDDGSTDDSLAVLRSYGARVRVFSQANGGEGSARNLAMRQMTGRYAAFLDSDDLYLPWALATFAEAIHRYEEPAMVFGAEVMFHEDATWQAVKQTELLAEDWGCYLRANPKLFWRGVNGNVIRTDVVRAVGAFGEERINALDIDYVLRAGAAPGFVQIHTPATFAFRMHAGAISRQVGMTGRGIHHLIDQEMQGRYPGGRALRYARRQLIALHARNVSLALARAGYPAAAWRLFLRTLGWNLRLGRWRYLFGFPPLSVAAGARSLLRAPGRDVPRRSAAVPPG